MNYRLVIVEPAEADVDDIYACVVDDEVRILRVRGPGQAPLKASDIDTR